MKVAQLTFNQAINYGAALQMFALQQILKNSGNEVEVLDYYSEKVASSYVVDKLFFIKPKQLYRALVYNNHRKYYFSGFEKFWKERIVFSKKKYTSQNIDECVSKYDLFIVGSDQVFNLKCSGYDDNYLLSFVKEKKKKSSYAASFGFSAFPELDKPKYYELLSSFNNISVREKSSVSLLEKSFSIESTFNVDPSLLLTKDEWEELCAYDLCEDTPYVLIYLLNEDKTVFRFAKHLAKKNNCRVVYINDRLIKHFGMKNVRKVNPYQWLGLIKKACAIVTNSYHGMLFSLNFGKRVYPFYLNANKEINNRFKDFSSVFGLDYLFTNEYRQTLLINSCSTDKMFDEKLSAERKRSIEYLKRITQ